MRGSVLKVEALDSIGLKGGELSATIFMRYEKLLSIWGFRSCICRRVLIIFRWKPRYNGYIYVIKHIMPWENRHGFIRSKWTRTVNSTKTANQSFVLPQVKILARDDTRERDPTCRLFFCFRKTWSLGFTSPNTSWCGIVWCLRTTVAINVFWRFFFLSSMVWRVFFSLFYWHVCLAYKMYITIQYSCGKWHT